MRHEIPDISKLVNTDFVFIEEDQAELPVQDHLVFRKKGLTVFYLFDSLAVSKRDSSHPLWLPTVSIDRNTPVMDMISLLCEHHVIVVEDDAGKPIGYLTLPAFLQSVFHAYRYLHAYFDTILSATDASISVIDENRRVAVWTHGAENIFAIKKNEIIGRKITDFFKTEMLQMLKTLKTGESVICTQHQPDADQFVLINASPVKLDDKIIGAVALETDMTTQLKLHHRHLHMTSQMIEPQTEKRLGNPMPHPFSAIIGSSRQIQQTLDMVKKISTTKATVLILGESGVGKELFAKAVHESREDNHSPFIAINCGAIPASLFESELFGYERGAFSGADQKGKKGKIELARGGTLFLDEIGEMPLDMQVKLLRVLQERNYYPVGGTSLSQADCRIVAATNKDLYELVKEGRFREDLYYRLNVLTIEIPPLRERKEDIFELTESFLLEFSVLYNRSIQEVPHTVMHALLQYSWPGNVRELRNTIERLVVLSTDGRVKWEYLPMSIIGTSMPPLVSESLDFDSLQHEVDKCERELISKVMKQKNGNKRAAAQRLGISRATLYSKMSKLGIE